MLNNELSTLQRRQPTRHGANRSSHPVRKSALQERLEHIVLLELTVDGYVIISMML